MTDQPTQPDSGQIITVALSEFSALRKEISDRSSAQMTFVNVNLTWRTSGVRTPPASWRSPPRFWLQSTSSSALVSASPDWIDDGRVSPPLRTRRTRT